MASWSFAVLFFVVSRSGDGGTSTRSTGVNEHVTDLLSGVRSCSGKLNKAEIEVFAMRQDSVCRYGG